MSLTVVLQAGDGLVMAADSRVTEGYTLDGPRTQDNSVKFLQLSDLWGIQTYGISDIGHSGITALKKEVSSNDQMYWNLPSLLEEAVRVFQRASSDWSRGHPESHRREKDVGFVLAGYDREGRELKIFNFQSPDFQPEIVRNGFLLAGQWHISKYFVRRFYGRDIPMERMKELAVFLLSATMTVEKTVGGAIHLAVVSTTAGFRWAMEDEIAAYLKMSERLEMGFREQLHASLMSVVDEYRRKISSGVDERVR